MGQTRRTGNAAGQFRGGSESTRLLTSPAFILAVALLLLNDWVLKAAVGNWSTGKLSDLAGLFAFSIFWTALFPRRRGAVFALTTAGFLLWKSPLSDAPLAAWNALGLWPLARVVDYMDWVALAALLPAYWLARRQGPGASIRPLRLPRRIAAIATAGIALAAFTATSILPPRYAVHGPTDYLIPATGREVRAGLQSLGLPVRYVPSEQVTARRRAPVETVPIDVDTLEISIRQPPERTVDVTVEVSEVGPSEVRLRLLTVSAYGPEPRSESIHRAFRVQVLEPLREWLARHRTPKG
ncbi:MAG: hypothetical protein ABR499_15700 [Gemmatimonadaceae bacterium]